MQHDTYWAHTLTRQPFYIDGLSFNDFAPALALGEAHWRDDTLLEDVLPRLSGQWQRVKGGSRLGWIEAQHAVRAAWERRDALHRQQTLEPA